jgi:hypothetical protein
MSKVNFWMTSQNCYAMRTFTFILSFSLRSGLSLRIFREENQLTFSIISHFSYECYMFHPSYPPHLHAYIRTYIYTYMNACAHSHTHAHSYIHTFNFSVFKVIILEWKEIFKMFANDEQMVMAQSKLPVVLINIISIEGRAKLRKRQLRVRSSNRESSLCHQAKRSKPFWFQLSDGHRTIVHFVKGKLPDGITSYQ